MKNNQFQRSIPLLILFVLSTYVMQAQFSCPFMRVSVASDGWVACDNAVTHIRVCNEGAQAANTSQLEVLIPNGFGYVASIPAPSVVSGQTLRYNMGAFAAGDCRNFALTLAVPCNAPSGAAYCVKATVTPANCPVSVPGWDGSNLVVKAGCSAPDSVWFRISNTSIDPTTSGPAFVITEDHLMRTSGQLPATIPGNDTTTVISWQNPTGGTYTFQTSQTPGHPFPEPISVSIEGCGASPGSTGYLLQYPQYDGNVHGDIFCDVITPSINGYGKTGFPLGYHTEHFIDKKSSLQYRIRFQNTSTTAVQTIILTDTLSPSLNLSTFRPGASSHPFTYSIQNQVLNVVFSNLQLPPAAVNSAASRGFFSFHIGVSGDAPLGTVIENKAAVKMGNLPSVQTDTTFHRLGENFIIVKVIENQPNTELSLRVIPNPVTSTARFEFSGAAAAEPVSLQISDVSGQIVRSLSTRDGVIYFEKDNLPAGIYFFWCASRSGKMLRGKIVVL